MSEAKSYSCEIEGHLEIHGQRYPLARLDSTHVGLQSPADIEPGDGELVMSYDGETERTPVTLPVGASAGQYKFPCAKR